MARITVEDCLTKETNRFGLVQLAAKRTKQLLNGAKPLISDPRGNKAVVTALREIADGKVRFMTAEEVEIAREQGQFAEPEVIFEAPPVVAPREMLPEEKLEALDDEDDDDDEDESVDEVDDDADDSADDEDEGGEDEKDSDEGDDDTPKSGENNGGPSGESEF